jgi:hypothetical protein
MMKPRPLKPDLAKPTMKAAAMAKRKEDSMRV